jgi:hypothetical protein
VIAYVWIGVIVGVLLLVLFFHDDDPQTDDGAGAGGLVFVVGGALTGAYLLVAKRLNARAGLVPPAGDAPPDTRRWVRRNAGPVVAAAAGVVVIAAATPFAPSEPRPDEMPDTTGGRSAEALAVTVRAAADRVGDGRQVVAVACGEHDAESDAYPCAVTFVGPACELWLADGFDDPHPVLILNSRVEGERGGVRGGVAHCA